MLKVKKQRLALLSIVVVVLLAVLWLIDLDSTTQIMGSVVFIALYLTGFYLILRKPIKKEIKEVTHRSKDILIALGDVANITHIEHCMTRVRLSVVQSSLVDDEKLRQLGILGVIKPSNTSVHLITKDMTEGLANELEKMINV